MSTIVHASQPDWLDLRRAEAEGPFSKRTLWNLISSGKLPAYRPLKRKVLIKRSDLYRLIESSPVGADLDTIVDETVAEVLGK
jgi:excisionase family DNA binding protein